MPPGYGELSSYGALWDHHIAAGYPPMTLASEIWSSGHGNVLQQR